MERAAIPESERKDFYIYVDEFQNVVTQTFENILPSPKIRTQPTIVHQYVGQIITGFTRRFWVTAGALSLFASAVRTR